MKWFEKIPKQVFNKAVERGLLSVGVLISGQASLLAPRDLGRLAGSITFATKNVGAKPEGPAKQSDGVSQPSSPYEVWIGTNVEYGPYQEYGTGRMGAQPYMRPAFKREAKRSKKLFMAEVMKEYGR